MKVSSVDVMLPSPYMFLCNFYLTVNEIAVETAARKSHDTACYLAGI